MALHPSRGKVTAVHRCPPRAIEVNRPYLRLSKLSPLYLQPGHRRRAISGVRKIIPHSLFFPHLAMISSTICLGSRSPSSGSSL
jgi:hypothetical protein